MLVDAGRVLVHPDDQLFRQEALAVGCTLAAGAATIALGRTVWEGAAASDPIAFWNSTAKIDAWSRHAGLATRSGRAVWERVHRRDREDTPLWSKPDPGAAVALQRLRQAGYLIAVVSNNDGRLHHQLTASGLIHHVNAVVDSAQVGLAKPSPEIFDHAATQLGVRLDQCVMIGDDPYFDIHASLHAGAAAALLIDPGDDRPCTWPTIAYPDLGGAADAVLDRGAGPAA
ncbi:HAD family hydrolase [Paractinoplanes toevensis]|uniref:HAD family hydrolase n=1 Tax=Paractinoplanes toevensis TaxID=571911 RepID=A0A919W8K8_9ACTN|nr:HAD family hydrolase [Actinoplanes toevensis]GIM94386.1 hypothetical protein Ato02nite_061790 [Actinoplanes toevensis]